MASNVMILWPFVAESKLTVVVAPYKYCTSGSLALNAKSDQHFQSASMHSSIACPVRKPQLFLIVVKVITQPKGKGQESNDQATHQQIDAIAETAMP